MFRTNIKYNIGLLNQSFISRDEFSVKKAYLLGKEYRIDSHDINQTLNEMKRVYSDIIWFSYRKNFPSLVSSKLPKQESYVSDTSWGCTIRSCQMLFAECLRQCILREDDYTEKIIQWFLDVEVKPHRAPYSIQSISNHIYEHSHIKPGNWLKPSTVLYALQAIHQKYSERTVNELEMEIYIEGTIYLNQAVKKVAIVDEKDQLKTEELEKEFEVVDNLDEFEDCKENCDANDPYPSLSYEESYNHDNYREATIEELFDEDAEEVKKILNMKWKKSLLIVVLAKIGLEKPNPEYLPFIKELLSFPESIGMLGIIITNKSFINWILGGKPGLAYYVVGNLEDKLIYLDPHFVQVNRVF